MNSQLNEEVIERAVSSLNGEIYYEPWCKPILFLIEYEQQDNPPYYEMADKNIQTEHVLPQAYNKIPDWQYAKNITNLDQWIHSGANLTLLSGKKNLDARNHPFETKIKSYDKTGFEEGSDRKVSSFKITQSIVNDYSSGKYNKTWNIEAMNNRWKWFCSQLERILNVDLSTIKENQIPEQ